MTKPILCLLALLTASVPCLADVVPTQYDQKSKAERASVQSRLEQLGSAPEAAAQRVRELSHDDLAFFASRPERLQSAGGLYWYEWVGGLVVLGGLTIIYIVVTND